MLCGTVEILLCLFKNPDLPDIATGSANGVSLGRVFSGMFENIILAVLFGDSSGAKFNVKCTKIVLRPFCNVFPSKTGHFTG